MRQQADGSTVGMRRVYHSWLDAPSRLVRIVLAEKRLDATLMLEKPWERRPDFLRLNPAGTVPVLIDDDRVLADSVAIAEYLDETHPDPALLPSDPLARARVRAMAQVIGCDIHPLNNLRVLKYLKDPLGHDQETVNVWYRHWIALGFEALEASVREQGSARYCFGDSPSLVDICLAPQMYNARRFETDLSPYPNLVRVDAHLREMKAFADAAPEAQPDAG